MALIRTTVTPSYVLWVYDLTDRGRKEAEARRVTLGDNHAVSVSTKQRALRVYTYDLDTILQHLESEAQGVEDAITRFPQGSRGAALLKQLAVQIQADKLQAVDLAGQFKGD